jgi:DNA-binding winged helix-turn-helix (wHTH) protein/Tol biopolymer transport system component
LKEKTAYIYEFESFRLDPERKSLWHADSLVSLTPKALETLLVLVRNSGEVVGKRELLDEVWADTFVEESTLSQNILTLRKTLAAFEDGKQFIATVPRRGYRFVAPVREVSGTNGNGKAAVYAVEGAKVPLPTNGNPARPARTAEKRRGFPIAAVTAVAIGVLLIGVVGVAWYGSRPVRMVEAKFREFRVNSLLSDANIRAAAISPDGKFLSLIEKRGDAERLLVRQMDGSATIEAVPPTDGPILGASFSPDSQYVYYSAYRNNSDGGRVGELFRVPLLGGPPQMIVAGIDSPVSVSKSGKLAFVRRLFVDSITQVVVADLDGRNERVVTNRKLDDGFQNAAISPDGRFIVSTANSKVEIDRNTELVLIDVETARQQRLTSQRWLWLGQSAWLPDGSGVAVVGYGAMSPDLTDEVWFVSVPDGEARMLEAGVNGVFGVSVTEDGNSIVAVKSDKITSFVVSPLTDLNQEQMIVRKSGDQSLLHLGADWASDDHIFYSTTDNGNADIWSIRIDGSDRKRLTADKYADLQPRLSPDGQFLYFLSNRSGQMSVWRSRADGTEPQKLTEGSDVFSITASPDGSYIYYTARADSVFSQHLWRAAADGKDPAKLMTSKTTLRPKVSPDGRSIACYHPRPEGGLPVLTILNAENGEIARQFPDRKTDFLHEWLKNGRQLLVLSRDGTDSSLWKVSVESGEAIQLRKWPNETVFRMTLSPDGDRLFFEKGVSVNNVLLLSNAD